MPPSNAKKARTVAENAPPKVQDGSDDSDDSDVDATPLPSKASHGKPAAPGVKGSKPNLASKFPAAKPALPPLPPLPKPKPKTKAEKAACKEQLLQVKADAREASLAALADKKTSSDEEEDDDYDDNKLVEDDSDDSDSSSAEDGLHEPLLSKRKSSKAPEKPAASKSSNACAKAAPEILPAEEEEKSDGQEGMEELAMVQPVVKDCEELLWGSEWNGEAWGYPSMAKFREDLKKFKKENKNQLPDSAAQVKEMLGITAKTNADDDKIIYRKMVGEKVEGQPRDQKDTVLTQYKTQAALKPKPKSRPADELPFNVQWAALVTEHVDSVALKGWDDALAKARELYETKDKGHAPDGLLKRYEAKVEKEHKEAKERKELVKKYKDAAEENARKRKERQEEAKKKRKVVRRERAEANKGEAGSSAGHARMNFEALVEENKKNGMGENEALMAALKACHGSALDNLKLTTVASAGDDE